MAIEHVIYGSFLRGIESNAAERQYYSYTSNYRRTVENIDDNSIRNKLELSYDFVTIDNELYIEMFAKPNDYADELMKRSPKKFAYWISESNEGKKACFSYCKDMGIDWTGSRPGSLFTVATVADIKHVEKYPINYSASPSVACEVSRREFFPEDINKIPKPELISDLSSLDDDFNINVNHMPAFDMVSMEEAGNFVINNNINVFKAMVIALMKLKDGDDSYRLLVADKKENMVYWIAAISYVFPVKNALEFSFSTYEYSNFSYDFNGVFRCGINNVKPFISEGVEREATRYDFEQCKASYAVFDFQEGYVSDRVLVDNIPFINMLDKAYKENDICLDNYKKFIETNTKYRGLNSKYIDGYNLYALCNGEQITLSFDKLADAYGFAKAYADNSVLDKALDVLIHIYPEYVKLGDVQGLLKEYIEFLIEKNILQKEDALKRLLNVLLDDFLGNSTEESFYTQGEMIEKIFALEQGALESEFVKNFGAINIEKNVKNIAKDAWKCAFIQNALCHYLAAEGQEAGEAVVSNVFNILYEMTYYTAENDGDYITRRMDYVNRVFNNPFYTLRYAEMLRTIFTERKESTDLVKSYVCEWYCNSEPNVKFNILKSMNQNSVTEQYIPVMLNTISKNKRLDKIVSEIRILIDNAGKYLTHYAGLIREIVIRSMMVGEAQSLNPECIYRAFILLSDADKKYGDVADFAEYKIILENYLKSLDAKYNDMLITKEEKRQLESICGYVNAENKDTNQDGLVIVCSAYSYLYTLNDEISSEKNNIIKVHNNMVDFCKLPISISGKFVNSIVKIASEQWKENNCLPEFSNLCYASDESKFEEAMIVYYRCIFLLTLQGEKNNNLVNKICELLKYVYCSEGIESEKKNVLINEFAEELAKNKLLKLVIRKYNKESGHPDSTNDNCKTSSEELNAILKILETVSDKYKSGFADAISGLAASVFKIFGKE